MYGQEDQAEIHSDFATWAMLQLSGRTLVGASTGQIYLIVDDSAEQEELKLQERQQKIQAEQQFLIFVNKKDYCGALRVALSMNNEKQAIRLFEKLRQVGETIDLRDFELEQIKNLVKMAKNWLRQTKTSECGIELTEAIFKSTSVMVIKQLGIEHDLVEMKALFQKQAARLEEM